MNIKSVLQNAAISDEKRALPILSFPAVQKLGVTVRQLVTDAKLQSAAMETIAHNTDTLACVSLMDLSVEAEAFGATIRFNDNEVPSVIGKLVSDEDEANSIKVPGLDVGRAQTCIEAITLSKSLISDKPVLAGMIGPFSLAGRLMDVTEIMYACYDEPETVQTVLDKATLYLMNYGLALKRAGADGIVLAEPLAGILSADMMRDFSKPYVKKLIDAMQDDNFSIIYHNCGGSVLQMLEDIFDQGAFAYHFGNAVDMVKVLKNAPKDAICMGNIDPARIFANGDAKSMREATFNLLTACAPYDNFVISSGCDIPAHAKWENIDAFFDAVKQFKA